jgi:CRISPR-associated protein Cmr6
LSRANALENGGIALHPLYGFAYLPGSGLKGAARAFAETIWLPNQGDNKLAHADILAVFGHAPNSEADKHWLPEQCRAADSTLAGALVFHDAWPEAWPKLFVDIAAIHHPKYYQAAENAVPPPGDWEEPSLISFLAIAPKTEFRFAVAPRAAGLRPEARLLDLAKCWLNGALTTLGAGAKAAAGYGMFHVPDFKAPALPSTRAEATYTLELVTPAFLAGGAQEEKDCDLRGATLRGQLRWWWRTLHAAYLEPRVLRRLEAAIWGTSSEGSAVGISLAPVTTSKPEKFDFRNDRDFSRHNEIPPPPQRGLTGVSYLSYGMADKPGERRYYRQPGDRWDLRLTARASEFRLDPRAKPRSGAKIAADAVLAQAVAALWLLSKHGGIGAKARKGFGCFDARQLPQDMDLSSIRAEADKVRRDCQVPIKATSRLEVSTLEGLLSESVQLGWTNAWYAIDAIGRTYQAVGKGLAPALKADKELLGTPRKSVRPKYSRLASALHLHLSASPNGLVATVTTFDLPGIRPMAATFLAEIRDGLRKGLREATARRGGRSALYPPPKGQAVPTVPRDATSGKSAGNRSQPAPADQPGAGPTFVGQRGYDSETRETVVVRQVDGNRLKVEFEADGSTEWIAVTRFKPLGRK